MTYYRDHCRNAIMVAALLALFAAITTHARAADPKLTPEEIKALAVALKAELVPELKAELKAELAVDLKAELKAEFAKLQKAATSTNNAKSSAASVSEKVTGIFDFQKNELDKVRHWLRTWGWHIEKEEFRPTGDGTIIATKPAEPSSTVQLTAYCTPVPMTQYAFTPVYLVPTRKHALLGCCR